ncbi:hypothetical protein KM043_015524 [Ampulex compressa]|nr:hypothetical protein KM043_015524 [Ampulex compressa]
MHASPFHKEDNPISREEHSALCSSHRNRAEVLLSCYAKPSRQIWIPVDKSSGPLRKSDAPTSGEMKNGTCRREGPPIDRRNYTGEYPTSGWKKEFLPYFRPDINPTAGFIRAGDVTAEETARRGFGKEGEGEGRWERARERREGSAKPRSDGYPAQRRNNSWKPRKS